ncbi:MAG: carboxyl transferase [Chloroflexi bacterium]|jgi:acetyl-CoA carboxylase carboxyltransferase component|nr:carboxyl transferase [Chloroflexota bacterium]MBT7080537.1 carboxyl transferase [Chloroflexota bacterium]MBT7289641.1 carboxyl transferase [Chloroflexota bacterium]
MVWEKDVQELNYRKALALKMGGEKNVAKHKEKGKYTVRERIDKFLDKGSFKEIGTLVGRVKYDDDGKISSLTPAAHLIGYGNIDGRMMSFQCGDHTVRGDIQGHKRELAARMAIEWKIPYIRLIEEPGGSVRGIEEHAKPAKQIHLPPQSLTYTMPLMYQVPVVSAALGAVAGYAAIWMAEAHFSIMTKENCDIFVAGPPVTQRAFGITQSKAEIGSYKIHAFKSGVVDNVAEDEDDLFRQIKRFMSYMPQNVWEQPKRIETSDSPDRRDEDLLSIIPKDRKKTYDIRKLISHIVDKDSMFEMTPYFGRSFVTILARIDGYPVAIMSNDCMHYAGAQTPDAADKMAKFIDMADTFHLPVIYLVDVPGFMVGVESESAGMIRRAARAQFALDQATVPWVSVLIRRRFGVAGGLRGSKLRLNLTYAWPSAVLSAMPLEGGVMAAYKSQIEAAPDPDAELERIEKRLDALNSPFRSGESMWYDEMIDPRETRPMLCQFVKQAYEVTKTQLGPKYRTIRP